MFVGPLPNMSSASFDCPRAMNKRKVLHTFWRCSAALALEIEIPLGTHSCHYFDRRQNWWRLCSQVTSPGDRPVCQPVSSPRVAWRTSPASSSSRHPPGGHGTRQSNENRNKDEKEKEQKQEKKRKKHSSNRNSSNSNNSNHNHDHDHDHDTNTYRNKSAGPLIMDFSDMAMCPTSIAGYLVECGQCVGQSWHNDVQGFFVLLQGLTSFRFRTIQCHL